VVPAGASDGTLLDKVTVAVHNDAEVSPDTLIRAEQIATSIFRRAGLEVDLTNCGGAGRQSGEPHPASCSMTQFPVHLQLRIGRRAKNLRKSAMGVSYLGEDGSGCYSDVFLEPAEELHASVHFDLDILLGHVMAHEIGHLLLGTNSHSSLGIMRAHWGRQDLEKANQNGLVFTPEEGKAMREKLSESTCRIRTAAAIASSAGR
jgi:hypothetical protein